MSMYTSPTGRKRLLRTYEQADVTTYTDLLHCCAVTVEDALIQGGAIPGQDYEVKDLYKMAVPIAVNMADDHTAITAAIPDDHPHSGVIEVKREAYP